MVVGRKRAAIWIIFDDFTNPFCSTSIQKGIIYLDHFYIVLYHISVV